MIAIYILIAVFIAWIWVDYFRLIDIYDKENLKHFVVTFLLGALSTTLVIPFTLYVTMPLDFHLNGDLLNDALFCFLGIGLPEELCKFLPFLIVYRLYKDRINEPIDYIVYISISALGFSAAENVMYFYDRGADVIDGRAILATVGHMFDTSVIAYGIIRNRYHQNKNDYHGLWKYVLLAAFCHGFYDFWLLYRGIGPLGWLITVLYFFITISLFATILNNALNHSSFFSYKKIINSDRVVKRMLFYYLAVFLAQFVLLSADKSPLYAIRNFQGSLFLSGFIIAVTVIRLSRFKLIRNRWENLRPEFPFSLSFGSPVGIAMLGMRIRVKGDSFNEAYVNAYFEEHCFLTPLSRSSTFLLKQRLIFIEKKIFLKNFESCYLARVYHRNEHGAHDTVLLKPKINATTMFSERHPIVGVYRIHEPTILDDTDLTLKDFIFREWAVIKPKPADVGMAT